MSLQTDYEIPSLEPKLFFGLSTNVTGNVHFLSNSQILHPAGKVLVIEDIRSGSQTFLNVSPSAKEISIIAVSPNRKYVAVGEGGAKPTVSVYEVSSLKRLKLLGVPLKERKAGDWACLAFLQGSQSLVGVTGDPDWTFLIYDWPRGKVLSTGLASQNQLAVSQVVPNLEDGTMLAFIGPGLFRLMSQSESRWRQYGFSRAEKVPLRTGCWLGPQQLLAGSFDGRLLLIDYGELRAVYQAHLLNQIHLTESVGKSSDNVILASQTVPEENKNGLHEVQVLISFENGFLYSCNIGEIYVFQKVQNMRWIRKNTIKIPNSSETAKNNELFRIHYASVNPDNNKLIVTTKKTELYVSDLFKEDDSEKPGITEMKLDGTGYHDGPIVALSSCLWKPIFLTAGAHDKTIRLWNYETLEVIMIKRFSDEIYSAAMHPSGFSCLLGFTDKLRLMLILAKELKGVRDVDIRGSKCVAFSGGGHLFAATRDHAVEVYSAVFFTRLHVLTSHLGPVTRLVFGAGDKCLWSCGGEGSLYQWDLDTGQRLKDIFTNQNGHLGLAVSEAVYTVGTDGNLKEIVNGEVWREVEMEQGSLRSVALGNSGQILFVGGEKGSIVSLLYPLVHPPRWREFVMHSAPIADIIVSHDDTTVITTSEDGFLCIWRIACPDEKKKDLNRGFGHITELLLSLQQMESMTAGMKELEDRLSEAEGEHEYAIRQIRASNETALRETNNNYNAIIEDLKFRNKQMEREHLVETNKIQNMLKELKATHGSEMDQLEKQYSDKLLAELRRIEELEFQLQESKQELERQQIKLNEEKETSLLKLDEQKNSIIKRKDEEIKEIENKLRILDEEKDAANIVLEEEYNKRKEDVGKSFISKILEKEALIGKLKTENGIISKTHLLLKKDIDELMKNISTLERKLKTKEEAHRISEEEIKIIKKLLEERDRVLAAKGRTIAKLNTENDVLKGELTNMAATVDAMVKQIAPKDEEVKKVYRLLEEKIKDIESLSKFKRKSTLEMEQLKKKYLRTQSDLKKNKIQLMNVGNSLRKLHFELHLATSNVYQPKLLKNIIGESLEKYLSISEYEIQEDCTTHAKLLKKNARMENVIEKLQSNLRQQKKQVKIVYKPLKVSGDLLVGFNQMSKELEESRRKVRYLETLLCININKPQTNKNKM